MKSAEYGWHLLKAGKTRTPALELVEEVGDNFTKRECACHNDTLRSSCGVKILVVQVLRAVSETKVHHLAQVLYTQRKREIPRAEKIYLYLRVQ